jgi:hypothetical protein
MKYKIGWRVYFDDNSVLSQYKINSLTETSYSEVIEKSKACNITRIDWLYYIGMDSTNIEIFSTVVEDGSVAEVFSRHYITGSNEVIEYCVALSKNGVKTVYYISPDGSIKTEVTNG